MEGEPRCVEKDNIIGCEGDNTARFTYEKKTIIAYAEYVAVCREDENIVRGVIQWYTVNILY